MEFQPDDDELPIDVWVDDHSMVCFSDTTNDYELAFPLAQWRALVAYVDEKLKEKFS